MGFVFENSPLTNYQSAFLGRPCPTDIMALEDSEVLVAPASLIHDCILNDPTLNIRMMHALYEQAYRIILDSYLMSPKERFIQLKKRFPQLMETVPMGDIATYLNISRRQFLRIRRETLETEKRGPKQGQLGKKS